MKTFRQFIQCAACVALVLANASCGYHEPDDLAVEQVFIADITSIPVYQQFYQHGHGGRDGLIVKLTSADAYPIRALIRAGFCGEEGFGKLGFVDFLRVTGKTQLSRIGIQETKDSTKVLRRYLVVFETHSILPSPQSDFPPFDLAHDRRDICLQTFVFDGDIFAARSNTVRVRRNLIDQAFHEDVQPLPKFEYLDP